MSRKSKSLLLSLLVVVLAVTLLIQGLVMAQRQAPGADAAEVTAQLQKDPDAPVKSEPTASLDKTGDLRPTQLPMEEALAKIHPDLRDLAQSAAPALPAGTARAAAAQEPVLIQMYVEYEIAPSGRSEDMDFGAYFENGKVMARPGHEQDGVKGQMIFGFIAPANLLKAASLNQVRAIFPVVLERNGQPDNYGIDDAELSQPERTEADWAALRQQAPALQAQIAATAAAGQPSVKQSPGLVEDWYEVMPAGPHKASAAWARGYDGAGVTVAPLDDGVDAAHPDLMGTQKIYSGTLDYYNGWPVVFSPISALLLNSDAQLGTTYVANGFPGMHYVDTSNTPALSACGSGISCFNFTPLIDYGVNNPFAPAGGYTYVISDSMSASGVVHVGTHPDNDLRDFIWGEKPAVLVTDPITPGVYSTVYVDLNDNYDFRDDAPLTRADTTNPATLDATYNDMISYLDVTGDGLADISGGMLYFIGNGANCVPGTDWLWACDYLYGPPGNGDLVAFSGGTFDRSYSHGTQVASNIVGQGVTDAFLQEFADLTGLGPVTNTTGVPNAAVYGMAPGAKIVNISDIYYNFASSKLDGYLFAAFGYDGCSPVAIWSFLSPCDSSYPYDPDDNIQITSNSYGASSEDNDGWEFDGQYVSQIQRLFAPNMQFMFSTGNGAPAYGTVAPPSPALGMGVGASTEFGSTGWDSITNTTQIMNNDVTPFSNRGPGARGTAGTSIVAGGAFAAGAEELNYYSASTWGAPNGNQSWQSWGGTSRSAPVAAGVMALIYQAYYDANGAWPTYDVARDLMMSSATDLNYDTFTQGAGSVNADRGTAVAAGEYGLYVEDGAWQPGDYRGTDYPAFAHIAYPGDTFARTFTVNNTGVQTITASIDDVSLQLIRSETFTFTVTPAMVAAESAYGSSNQDNFFKAFNYMIPITATAGMDASWYNIDVPANTDLMIVRQMMPFDQFDANGDYSWDNRYYLAVYNWEDINSDGDVWNDTDGNGVVNFINDPTTVGSQADGAMELDWNDSRTELDRWEFGRFSYNRPVGNRGEMWVHDPLDRMIDGLFIGLRHHPGSSYTGTTVLSYRVDFYEEADVSWLKESVGSLQIAPGTSITFTATVDVPAGMPAGMYEAAIQISDPGWMTYTADTAVVPIILNVGAVYTDGLQLGGMDAYNYSENADAPYNNAAVRGLFDWSWRAESGDWRFFSVDVVDTPTTIPALTEDFEGAFPPAGWTVITNTGAGWNTNVFWGEINKTNGSGQSAVSSSDAFGNGVDSELWTPSIDLSAAQSPILTYESNFQDYAGDGDAYLDISTDGGATWTNLTWFTADWGPTSEEVDLSAYAGQTIMLRWQYVASGWAWYWHIDDVWVGDYITQYSSSDKLLVKDEWNDGGVTDIDTIILGPTNSGLSAVAQGAWAPNDYTDDAFFGPYTLDTVGKSPNTNTTGGVWLFDTSSGGPEDWVTAPIQDGLHEILQHNVLFEGDQFDVVFTKTLGTMSQSALSLAADTYLPQGAVGTATFTATLPINGIVADAYGPSAPETLTAEPLPFVSSNSIEWIDFFTVDHGAKIQLTTSSADVSDIDLYLFYCGPTGSSCSQRASSTTSSANEFIEILFPEDGVWLVGINNWSGPAGTFNITRLVVQGSDFSVTGTITNPVPANSGVPLVVNYANLDTPGVYEGLLIVGIPESPALTEVPITINRIAESASVVKTVDSPVNFPGNQATYTIDLFNSTDASGYFEFADPIPAGTQLVTFTGSVTLTYDMLNDQLVYTGSLPLGSVYDTYTVDDTSTTAAAEWINTQISGTATLAGADDAYAYPITPAFNVPFFGWDYSNVAVGSNGTVYFEDNYLGYGNTAIPGTNIYGVNTFMAPFWDDLEINGAVYYLEGGTAPNRWLAIEFVDTCSFISWPSCSAGMNFEVVIYEDGTIKFLYKDVDGASSQGQGGSATVGLQDDPTLAVQYSYNTTSLSDDLAIIFTPAVGIVPSASIDVVVELDSTITPTTWITNTAMLTATHFAGQPNAQVEPMASDSVALYVGGPELSTSYKTASAEAATGGLIKYEIHVINSGESATTAVITDSIPANTTFYDLDAAPPAQAFGYDNAADQVEWAGTLTPGQEVVLTYWVQVDSNASLWGATIANSAAISWGSTTMSVSASTNIIAPVHVYLPLTIKN